MALQKDTKFVNRSQVIAVENLAAGADIADRLVWVVPCPGCRIVQAKIFGPASTGIDGSNTLVVALKGGSDTLFSLTRTANTVADTAYDLTEQTSATLPRELAAGTSVKLSVTQGATADMGAFYVQFDWTTDGLIPA